jgi:hypothetical protein
MRKVYHKRLIYQEKFRPAARNCAAGQFIVLSGAIGRCRPPTKDYRSALTNECLRQEDTARDVLSEHPHEPLLTRDRLVVGPEEPASLDAPAVAIPCSGTEHPFLHEDAVEGNENFGRREKGGHFGNQVIDVTHDGTLLDGARMRC